MTAVITLVARCERAALCSVCETVDFHRGDNVLRKLPQFGGFRDGDVVFMGFAGIAARPDQVHDLRFGAILVRVDIATGRILDHREQIGFIVARSGSSVRKFMLSLW